MLGLHDHWADTKQDLKQKLQMLRVTERGLEEQRTPSQRADLCAHHGVNSSSGKPCGVTEGC